MKVGIVTLTGYFNYGNRLQNFALQKVLKSLNNDVETIEIGAPHKTNLKNLPRKLIVLILSIVKHNKYQGLLNKYKSIILEEKRTKRIYKWSRKNIKNSKYRLIEGQSRSNINNSFDYFIAGSDQVWNPYYSGYKGYYFLDFADENKRLSYAASFGVSEIPENNINEYKSWLSQMKSISVREHDGKNIVNQLTNKNATLVLDPTMLLNKADWQEVMTKPSGMLNKKYILTYFLGEKDDNYNNFINSLMKEKKLEVVDVLDASNNDLYCVNPGEFIYLINNAEVMVTDSFHGAVFSIIMHTPFVIFERQDNQVSMNSRIETLISTFKMNNRLSSKICSIDDVFNIDFKQTDEILKVEQKKSLDFLKNALHT